MKNFAIILYIIIWFFAILFNSKKWGREDIYETAVHFGIVSFVVGLFFVGLAVLLHFLE